ncbi:MAG: amino acid adenylation domain-containing protein, partial [Verrucomicrobia bacterium]|nr:amino acid adenylation domain-containing protein [Verrucomicrobiota bacterium]
MDSAALSATASAAASFAQQRLWFLDRFEPGGAVYNIPLAVRLRGPLDRAAVAAALGQIAARHETLRTTFAIDDGDVVQIIAAEAEVALRDAGAADEGALKEGLAAEARRPFDLTRGPLWRAVLWCRASDDHVLQLTVHHIVCDGWSLGVLVAEFGACYRAHLAGETAALPELAVQYADFAAWQRDWLQGETLAAGVAYWREQLADAPADLPLPTDRPRPAVQGVEGRTHRFAIGAELTRALKELSRHGGGSLFMTLLGGFAVLLHRLSERADFVIGTPVANRTRSEMEPMIGFFVNALALRLDLTADPTVRALLEQVRRVTLDALAHQDVPFEKLVQELRPGRTLGHTPFFQVMFVLQNAPLGELRLPNLTATPVEVDTGTAKFDLTLALEESAGVLIGRLEYNLDLFEADTIERFARRYVRVLEQFVTNPAVRVAEVELLEGEESAQLLRSWTATARPYSEQALGEMFAAQAAARPEAVAVEFGAVTLTYAELDARANRLAHHLRAAGVGPEVCVGLAIERSVDLIVALVGMVKAGGAYVALDAKSPASRWEMMLADAAAPVVLTHAPMRSRCDELAAGNRRIICLDRDRAKIDRLPETAPAVSVTLEHLAYVSFTSGSTGRPKGVAIPQRGVVRLVRNTDYATFDENEVVLHAAPVAFDASTFEIWGPLLNGGRVVVLPPGTPSLEDLGGTIARHGVTTIFLTTGLFNALVDERLDDLRGLRQLLTGGEVCSPGHFRRAAGALPGCRLIHCYGPTENTTFTTCHAVQPADFDGATLPIGRPIANTQVYVLDPHQRLVPIGVPGELCTGGAGLARGYLGNPELTAEKFVANPFGPGRLYRTGDRVRWRADGTIEFLGRLDTQLKLRGYRIEPGEIESALLAAPGVKTAVVVAHEVSGRKQLAGYVTGAVDGAAVRAHLQTRLPDYLVPAAVVVLETLPLNANGKVDRAALPPPDFAATADAETFAPPRTPTEEILAHLWARVLGADRVGVQDNFFSIGGHSLLATQLVTRIREAFGVELPLRAVFEAPAVASLAARIEEARRDGAGAPPPLCALPRTGELPLSFAQERLWFLNQLEPGNPFYNMPTALRLQGTFDVAAGARVLRELGRRHESLRTVFASVDGRPVQRILPEIEFPLPVVDLSPLAAGDR